MKLALSALHLLELAAVVYCVAAGCFLSAAAGRNGEGRSLFLFIPQ